MKASDYIVDFLINQGCKDIFGYQGGMISHFVNSLGARKEIHAHLNYHEQAVAFAACGYAQAGGGIGVAYCSSGPGATNLITGICHAYYDSVPVIFITGQVNTYESKGSLKVRQKAFQETDIVGIVKDIVKGAFYIQRAEDLRYFLEKAYFLVQDGRPGPVLLDIPMNVQRMEINPQKLKGFTAESKDHAQESNIIELVKEKFNCAQRPCVLLGAGIKSRHLEKEFSEIVTRWRVPTVTSMIAFDILASDNPVNYGFIGAYGKRYSNFILAKCDLLVVLGSRLDVRQIGANKENFAPNAKLIRFDIDINELENKIKEDECQIICDLDEALAALKEVDIDGEKYKDWQNTCIELKNKLAQFDCELPNTFFERISSHIPKDWSITTDVGQNQVWAAQSLKVSGRQKVLFSGGHGAMGYSLPAAIGATIATHKGVVCFVGDGGMQMNIQELQTIWAENLPIKILVINNRSLGMIRHFQEMYFDGDYTQTVEGLGYTVPNFCKVADAFGICARSITGDDCLDELIMDEKPELIEVLFDKYTHVYPKLEFGKPNQDQEPLLDRDLYNYLMSL